MSVSENDNQPVQQPSGSENPTKPVGMLTYFWWTILTLISVTVVLLILATINQNHQPEEERRAEEKRKVSREQRKEGPRLEEELRARAEQKREFILRSVLNPKLFAKTDNAIDETIDSALEPIYAQIPKFLDWHYSVPGQYQQLSTAALGYLKSQMESQLFSGVNERLEDASANINETFKAELDSIISQKMRDEVRTVDNASRDVYEKILDEVTRDSIQRFKVSVTGSGVTAFQGAIAGKALFGTITTAMSKKLFASVVIKTAGKMATKMAGAGGAAASGAAVGALLGPVGAAVGGVVGGIVGWFTIDAVVVTIDKYFNRDEFEKELITRINEQKNKIKSSLQAAKSKKLEELSKTLDNVPPYQM